MVVLIPGGSRDANGPSGGHRWAPRDPITHTLVAVYGKYLPNEVSRITMDRHAPLTDDQLAAVADRAVEQVADTLAELGLDLGDGQTPPSEGDYRRSGRAASRADAETHRERARE